MQGQVALITGATRGIGRAAAFRLGAAGCRLAINGRDRSAVDETVSVLMSQGIDAAPACADVTTPEGTEELVESLRQRFGGVDILVNNAGRWAAGPSLAVTERDWDDLLALNLKAVFFMAQGCARLMARQGGGSIVQVGSIIGPLGVPERAAYSAAKAGIEGLTRTLACEWAALGIRVNTVAPGFINTVADGEGPPPDGRGFTHDEIARRTPMGRWGTPREVAEAICFLASPAAGFITGTTMFVDGGWHAYGGW